MENPIISLVFDLLTLLTDTYKIYIKNGRLMALIAMLIVSLHSMLFLFHFFYIQPLIPNLMFGAQKETHLFTGAESLFLFIFSIAHFFLAISTIHASALIHAADKAISIKEFMLKTVRSLKRPFLTCFYISLLCLGYFVFCLLTFVPLGLNLGNRVASILLTISAMVLYSYLSVVWSLSLVVSALEEESGIEALGKAARIVKGMKLVGFVLNVAMVIVTVILNQYCLGFVIVSFKPKAVEMAAVLAAVSLVWMVRMFVDTAFTVLYFRCKKAHGEEIVLLEEEMEYTKLQISNNIP